MTTTQEHRAPVHVLYGGAHLFRHDAPPKLAAIARRALDELGDVEDLLDVGAERAKRLRDRVAEKLEREAIEDLRVDFEDGFGVRAPADEDAHAERVATEIARAMDAGVLPRRFGVRIKALGRATRVRALRTLHLLLDRLIAEAGRVPRGFVVTLPKVRTAAEVTSLVDALDLREEDLAIPHGAIAIELMVETADAIVAKDGRCPLHDFVVAARGRCVGAHFGAYDYLAELGVMAPAESALRHPACDHARRVMQVALASHRDSVSLADGATTLLPLAAHKGDELTEEQRKENAARLRKGTRLHLDNVARALEHGFYQGWDLHPAQLPARYLATYRFYEEHAASARERLAGFEASQRRAREVAGVFDDAATIAMLERFLTRVP